MQFPTFKFELEKITAGIKNVAGCDEVGVAPLAGPVVAAAVILDPATIGRQRSRNKWWYRVRDSKTVNEEEREELVEFIKEHALSFAVGEVSHETIDEINIHQASLLAMKKAIEGLSVKPEFIFLDGPHEIKNLSVPQAAVIDGDAKILSIAAASIIAKVARDKMLKEFHGLYPDYGFLKHKGYPTKEHHEAISKFGVLPIHRKTFGFVKQQLNPRGL